MPMTPAERDGVLSEIGQILEREIHGEFMDLYAAAVAATEKQPDQVNNEMRNVITHFARAISADSRLLAEREMFRARGHMERAKKDAVKIAVLCLRASCDQLCNDIRRANGTIEYAFLSRKDEIAKTRKAILKEETRGEEVINRFVALYLDADKLNDDLISEFGLHGKRLPRWRYIIHAFRRNLLSCGIGIFLGLIATVVGAILIPDAAAFGHKARQFLHLESTENPKRVLELTPPPAASSQPRPAKPDVTAPRP